MGWMDDQDGSPADAEKDVKTTGGRVLRGQTVAPGLALGRVCLQADEVLFSAAERSSSDQVDRELNRFRRALEASRAQITDLREKLRGRVPEDEARILDTHVTYLRDSVFIADVENLILNENLRLEAAIGKVIGDFDRIFRLVQSASLRQSAVDLRDVGVRVLRNLALEDAELTDEHSEESDSEAVLVARELTIVDLFTFKNEHVRGMVTQEGGLTGHAAIFARSMRIPTVVGVAGLLDEVREGDFVILDATEGILRVNPGSELRRQYVETASAPKPIGTGKTAPWIRESPRTRDGEEIRILASCGNLPEAQQAAESGFSEIGLYRTELLYLVDSTPPSRDSLVHHYGAVLAAVGEAPVTFRTLNVDSSMGVSYLHPEREKNPSLGRVGIRALLSNENVLRRQLQAFLIAGADFDVRIALPFVHDLHELRRVRQVLGEARQELRREELAHQKSTPVGIVIEAPVAIYGLDDLASEADFFMVNLDSLQQHLLAIDREDPRLARAFGELHPFCVRALREIAARARAADRPLSVFGVSSRQGINPELLIGCGFRTFCVPPAGAEELLHGVEEIDLARAQERAQARARGEDGSEEARVAAYRHGYSPE